MHGHLMAPSGLKGDFAAEQHYSNNTQLTVMYLEGPHQDGRVSH
jgi:hypothetical protein